MKDRAMRWYYVEADGPCGMRTKRVRATDPDDACALATDELDKDMAESGNASTKYKLVRVRETDAKGLW